MSLFINLLPIIASIVTIIGGTLNIIIYLNRLKESMKNNKKGVLILSLLCIILGIGIFLFSYYSLHAKYLNLLGTPKVSISNVFNKDCYTKVAKDSAGFKNCVEGTTLDANGKYLCIVVNDNYNEYVEPGSDLIKGTSFSKYFQLGIENDSASIGKAYYISAVVTNQKYNDSYPTLDKRAIIARSDEIKLIRKW